MENTKRYIELDDVGGRMEKIVIKKSSCADTRTCDFTKVTKEQLLQQSEQHIDDIQQGFLFLISLMEKASKGHDRTKISNIHQFFKDFQTGFKNSLWWEMHKEEERHHFNDAKYIQEDVNLIDVIEMLIDGVMAGLARSGEYRQEDLPEGLLQKAFDNTVKLLLDNVEVKED